MSTRPCDAPSTTAIWLSGSMNRIDCGFTAIYDPPSVTVSARNWPRVVNP